MNLAQTAPKDGNMILAWFEKWGFPMPAVWSVPSNQWCVAVPRVELYEGQWNDWHFENEYFDDAELKGWADPRSLDNANNAAK
jgi:hypothetical protein